MWKPQPRRNSDGWAAFDLKHRQKQHGLVPLNHNNYYDPFPPISPQPQPQPHHQLPKPKPKPKPIPKPTSLTLRPFSSRLPQTQTQNRTLSNSSSATATATATGSLSLNNRPKHHDLHHSFTHHVMDMNMEAVHDIHNAAADSSHVSGDTKITSLPVEPEWHGDHHQDLYLTLRKNAFTTFRSASQHSREAANAFIRGDHFSAKQHSLKAQQRRLAAQKLNNEAAREILTIKNSKNDIWELDLHGLHAAEAIQILKEHLQKIETQVYFSNRSLSPASVTMEGRIGCSSSLPSFTCMDVEKLDGQQASSRQRPTSLQVITGVGNHSRGQAALPTAVRGFLNENRYRYEEVRPGVITVRPKYRNTNW